MLSGCVSQRIEPEHKPKLSVAQSSDGMVVFSLETEVGYEYQILYQNPADRTWKLVKGCESIKGTGKAVVIRKYFNARGELPPFTVNYVKYTK